MEAETHMAALHLLLPQPHEQRLNSYNRHIQLLVHPLEEDSARRGLWVRTRMISRGMKQLLDEAGQ